MLASRDASSMVNMHPYMEEYRFQAPKPAYYGTVIGGAYLSVRLPFFTNLTRLAEGDLLVLPYDGGVSQVCCETFPPISQSVVCAGW